MDTIKNPLYRYDTEDSFMFFEGIGLTYQRKIFCIFDDIRLFSAPCDGYAPRIRQVLFRLHVPVRSVLSVGCSPDLPSHYTRKRVFTNSKWELLEILCEGTHNSVFFRKFAPRFNKQIDYELFGTYKSEV